MKTNSCLYITACLSKSDRLLETPWTLEREVEIIEEATDRCEDVADVLGVVIQKNA